MGTRARGFSLVELVLVMLIIGTVAAIAAPRYASALSHYRADSAARRVAVDLDMARTLARRTSTPQVVRFTPATHSYEIVGYQDLDRPGDAYVVSLTAYPYEAQITAVSLGGSNDLTFDAYGKPTLAANGTITVRSGAMTRTITLNASSGRAEWE